MAAAGEKILTISNPKNTINKGKWLLQAPPPRVPGAGNMTSESPKSRILKISDSGTSLNP